MTIFFISPNVDFSEIGRENRYYILARELCKSGHRAVIINQSENCGRQKNIKSTEIDGISVISISRAPDYPMMSEQQRRVSFARRVKAASRGIFATFRPDSIVVSSSCPECMDIAAAMATLNARLRTCFDISEVYKPQNAANRTESKYLKYMQRMQVRAIEKADRTISPIYKLSRHLKELNFYFANTVYLPDGADAPHNSASLNKSAFKTISSVRNLGKFVLMYGGNSDGGMISDFADCAAALPEIVQLVIVTADNYSAKAIERLSDKPNITMVKLESSKEISAALELSDALFMPKSPNLSDYDVSSDILTEYFFAKRPIIFSSGCDDNPVSAAKCGITVAPSDGSALREAITHLCSLDEPKREKIGSNALAYASRNLNIKKLAARFVLSVSEINNADSL